MAKKQPIETVPIREFIKLLKQDNKKVKALIKKIMGRFKAHHGRDAEASAFLERFSDEELALLILNCDNKMRFTPKGVKKDYDDKLKEYGLPWVTHYQNLVLEGKQTPLAQGEIATVYNYSQFLVQIGDQLADPVDALREGYLQESINRLWGKDWADHYMGIVTDYWELVKKYGHQQINGYMENPYPTKDESGAHDLFGRFLEEREDVLEEILEALHVSKRLIKFIKKHKIGVSVAIALIFVLLYLTASYTSALVVIATLLGKDVPGATPTPGPTAIPTLIPGPTAMATATPGPGPTIIPTVRPSPTATPSPTLVPTPKPSPTATPSGTPVITLVPTPTTKPPVPSPTLVPTPTTPVPTPTLGPEIDNKTLQEVCNRYAENMPLYDCYPSGKYIIVIPDEQKSDLDDVFPRLEFNKTLYEYGVSEVGDEEYKIFREISIARGDPMIVITPAISTKEGKTYYHFHCELDLWGKKELIEIRFTDPNEGYEVLAYKEKSGGLVDDMKAEGILVLERHRYSVHEPKDFSHTAPEMFLREDGKILIPLWGDSVEEFINFNRNLLKKVD